jgi:CRISPR-associated endonuclease/helicase Cas3
MGDADFAAFFARATGGTLPFPYQRAFAESATLPDVIVAPTGAGKTATAVLGWLWRRRGHADLAVRAATPRRLVFCLPMRTLVEQTHRVTTGWLAALGLDGAVKVHMLLGGAVDDTWDAHPEKDAILVGTQDQLLSRALCRGYAMSRYRWPIHFALLNSDCLWMLDEVQLMGVAASTSAQMQAFRERLGTAGPTASIWMSATLAPGRLATVDHRDRALRTLELTAADLDNRDLHTRHHAAKPIAPSTSRVEKSPKALAAEIRAAHVPGSLTLVVVNQVPRARALYSALRSPAGAAPVRLVHSRFRPRERRRIQDEVLGSGWSGILVATQAIEAGVDISARILFTEVARWSSLVQRFGRCNRRGTLSAAEARVFWMEVDDDDALPYTPDELAVARAHLRGLADVGPVSLAGIALPDEEPTLPVIRRRDVLDLFDTQPDLAGADLDVSRYIRDGEDRDVQVAWREIPRDGPPADEPDLHRDELCSVPINDLRTMLKKGTKAYRWSGSESEWEPVRSPVPGMTILLARESGGYDVEMGWTADAGDLIPTTELGPTEIVQPDADDREHLSWACDTYVSLRDHSDDVASEATALAHHIAGDQPWSTIERAARWHDLGKVHPVFQTMLTAAMAAEDDRRQGGPWAKSDGRPGPRASRPGFRHELASALALLQQGGSDLEAYLVAAHHGKVRISLRARPNEKVPPEPGRRFALGIWDHDELPEVDLGDAVISRPVTLDLALMELGESDAGPSWLARTTALLAEYGPFRLAYWEMLVRIADWRGTERRRSTLKESP